MIERISYPKTDRYYRGYLLHNHALAAEGDWIDTEGCNEVRLTLEGMQSGDEVLIYGANTVTRPVKGTPLIAPSKPYTKNLEISTRDYRWYRAIHVKASGNPVTLHFYGWSR